MNADELEYYVQRLSTSEDAYYALLTHTDASNVPQLIAAYHTASDKVTCISLIEIIYQYHVPATLDFLASILQHPNAEFWQVALDGLVYFSTPSALTAVQNEKDRLLSTSSDDTSTRSIYLDEAIQQLTDSLNMEHQ